jgi:hypothetical protein
MWSSKTTRNIYFQIYRNSQLQNLRQAVYYDFILITRSQSPLPGLCYLCKLTHCSVIIHYLQHGRDYSTNESCEPKSPFPPSNNINLRQPTWRLNTVHEVIPTKALYVKITYFSRKLQSIKLLYVSISLRLSSGNFSHQLSIYKTWIYNWIINIFVHKMCRLYGQNF